MPTRVTAAEARRLGKGISEKQFMKQVLQLAKLRGWLVAHFRPAMSSDGRWMTPVQADGAGFPDLILARDGCILAIELKVGHNKTTLEQRNWLLAFDLAGIYAAVWKPVDWPTIERVLEKGGVCAGVPGKTKG